MNNEEKARAIIGEDCKKENCLQCGGRYSAEKGGCAEYQKIMQMAQWKDEQYKNLIKERIDNCLLTDAYEGVQYETYVSLFKDLFNEEP